MTSLFVVDLTYVAPLAEVERFLEAHRAHLRKHYDRGTFLASGRKEPRTGGVILAAGGRADIDEVVAADPFSVHGVAEFRVTEFVPTMTGPELAARQAE